MSSDQLIFFVLAQAAFFALVGGMIGNAKGRPGTGVVWGFILGIFGVIIIALMPPTKKKEAERNQNLANAFASASGGHPIGASSSVGTGQSPDFRNAAIAEAVRREPALRGADDPESLGRLGDLVAQISEELRLKADLERIQKTEEDASRAAASRAAATLEAEAERARRVAEAEESKRLEAERLAGMNPARRWIHNHQMGTVFIAVALLVALVTGVVVIKTAQDSARVAAAAEAQAAVDAAAASEQAAADATRRAGCATGTGPCKVGDPGPGGGIVFYDAGSKQRWGTYLEVSPAGVDLEAPWCKEYQSGWPNTDSLIGAGLKNTERFSAVCPEGAANVAAAYQAGGLEDWFLPSVDELMALATSMPEDQRSILSLQEGEYWSSTTGSGTESNKVWFGSLAEGSSRFGSVTSVRKVRPIRAF
jgi:hypothetical protein